MACGLPTAPPQQGPHSRQQLFDRKGFRQVVIGARVQTLHPLIDLRPGREDQHRRLNLFLPEFLQNLQTEHSREHEIQDDQVVAPAQPHFQTLRPVGTHVDGIILLLQRPPDERGDLGFVLDDQYPHGRLLKKPSSFVLSRSNPSTYSTEYASGSSLPAALPDAFLSSLLGYLSLAVRRRHERTFGYQFH